MTDKKFAFCGVTANAPKISVIVPVRDASRYLLQCLDSLAGQSYRNLQVILVENGSQDNSRQLCEAYAQKDDRFEVHLYTERGVSAARNYGLAQAQGSLIGFVDADDWVHPQMYEQLYNALCQTGADFAAADFWRGETPPEPERLAPVQAQAVSQQAYAKRFFKIGSQQTLYYIWNCLFRRTALESVRFPIEFSVGEDVLFSCQAILNARKIALCNQKLYFYRCGSGVTSGFTDAMLKLPDVWEQVVQLCAQKAPQYLDYARINRARSNFTLLTELSLGHCWREPAYRPVVHQCLAELKANRKLLMEADIDLKRKVLIQGYCMDYRLCASILARASQGRNHQ